MSKLPRTMEYEHTSWSEDDPLCAQLKRRADAMRDELLARVAVMLTTIGSRDGDLKRTFDSLGIAVARITELEAMAAKYKWQREIQVVGALDYNGAIAILDELWESHLREQHNA